MRKFSVVLAYIGIIVVCIVLSTATYAYVTYGGEDVVIKEEPTLELLHVEYTDTSNISMFNSRAGDEFEKTFNITNVSGKEMYYDINMYNVANSFAYPDDLVYTLSSENGAYTSMKIVPVKDESIAKNIKIGIDETHKYVLKVSFLKREEDQFENELKTFFAKLSVTMSDNKKYAENTLYKKIELSSMGSEKDVDFSNELSEGVFYTNATLNGITTYFYRGSNLLNNNLVLGNNCYKIIRTTESGDVKVIFNGKRVDNTCEDVNVAERLSKFNNNSNYNAYVGYMYGNASSSDYVNEHLNESSSVVKIYLDSWYNTNLKDYSDMISNDGVFCSNRKTSSFTYNKMSFGNEGFSNNVTGYDMMNKYYNTGLINLNCENINDRFSVSDVFGNNELSNSIGLISVEELYYAGFNNMKDNKNNYLYSIYPYWTMTPAYYNKGNAYNFIVNKNNLGQVNVSLDSAIRPVIVLKGDLVINAGDGSMENPYTLSK